ncbi:hypothetical protein ACIQMY_24590 [Streptomyces sp. NPDC091368]|uniref:hypothetical protein n=1 Tax=Streptomyces sp. NPDC091368 TaxID=3365993 RepID=UPI00382B9B67
MSDWQQIVLGQLFSVDNSKLGAHADEPTVMSLSKYNGFVRSDDYFDKRIASEKLDGYKTVEPGGWAYSTIHIDEGSIARNNLGETGVISPMYTTLRWRGDGAALPEYAELMVRSPRMLAEYANNAQGSVNRRRSLPFKAFSTIPTTLPPLSTQERIVKVIGAVDDQITALDAETDALHGVLRRLRAELVNDQAAPTVRADEAFEITMGRQRAPKYATGPYMTPYLRSANVGYGTLNLADVLEMNFDPIEREVFGLVPGDVLVSEGSASHSAVGMPAMWRGELPEPICFQKTLMRYRAIEGVSVPAFVNHWCLWAYESGTFLDIAGGTNIKHITAMRAVRMPVRLPAVADQARIASELDALSEVVASTQAEANRLRSVRAGLLAGLLDQSITIDV